MSKQNQKPPRFTELLQAVGNNIRDFRIKKGWTSEELSFKTHISVSTISHIENARSDPHFSTIANIAQQLGCSIEELIAPQSS